MLRIALLAAASLGAAPAAAEFVFPEVEFPALPETGRAPADFVPAGWSIEKQGRTDLDKDGRDDFMLVLRMEDEANIVGNDGLGPDAVDTNPRLLIVGVQREDGHFALRVADHTLIPRHAVPTMDDPFHDAVAGNGVLKVSVGFWASAGSWTTTQSKFTFRLETGCLRLIGYDHRDTHRGSGEVNELSVNYLTAKVKESRGAMEDDALKATWRELKGPRRVCIEAIGDALEFHPVLQPDAASG